MRRYYLLAVWLLFWAGCAGPRAAQTPAPEAPAGVPISAVEDFPSEDYPVEIPPPRIQVTHDVPEALLSGRADLEEGRRQVDGFRIQIFSTTDRQEAERVREAARAWWDIRRHDPLAPTELIGEELPVYIVYQPPFYRVRIGDFTRREDAERVLDYFREKFRSAWIVPDKVYLNR